MQEQSPQLPLVSVGMPVYNGERYVEAAIHSNLEQTYPHFELLISDNASTDATEEICRSFADADERVKYSRNPVNIGAAANYNKLVAASHGKYFRWSNADDLISPHLLERTLPVLESSPDVVIAYGRTCLINAQDETVRAYDDNLNLQSESASQRYLDFRRQLGLTNIIYGLMRRSAMQRTDLFGNGKLPAADVNFMAAMVLLGKFVEIPEVLFYRRMHELSFSASAGRDPTEREQFWRARRRPTPLPTLRAQLADVKAIVRSPLLIGEKMELLKYSAKRLVWQRERIAEDMLNFIRSSVRIGR